ncbi:tyrosine-type recombinase/integrase [Pseudomonas costantinii]|uniref:tyrosine-type recombinase/integrase n=1 Tax=Pseudomonas costantinii TaxID=168469 RepID=UPI0015A06880|nr:tyrosine-type recombinase/integrase [Pseudomonas costantinii]NVZ18503.1 tyrosine-type recombinase/integrase [Pseudomonas costantinii]
MDRLDATREELWERLRYIAEGVLEARTEWNHHGGMGLTYSDINDNLKDISLTEPLNVEQAKIVPFAQRVMWAAERRAEGDFGPILKILEEIKQEAGFQAVKAPVELPLRAPVVAHTSDALTFAKLAELHTAERSDDWQPNTRKSKQSGYKTLSALLGGLDLRTHTRKDMTDLKERLMEGRKVSTANKMLIDLSSVMTWAEDNGYIDKSYDKGLLIRKGAESEREAYSTDQVKAIMAYANGLPIDSWQRWGLSLGVVTGARVGELHQLTTADVFKDGDQLVIDVNENEGKTLKNKFSVRQVPVVDSLGFDLEAFEKFAQDARGPLFTMSLSSFSSLLNERLRAILRLESKSGLSFHSLRHHLAGALKFAEVPLGTAQEVLGHSSGSITFDLYGSGRSVQTHRMAEALKEALSVGELTYLPNKNLLG